jgi:hypothetical protein
MSLRAYARDAGSAVVTGSQLGSRCWSLGRRSLPELRSAVAMGLQFRRRYDIAFGVATGFRSEIHVDIEWGMALWAVGSINTEVVGVRFWFGSKKWSAGNSSGS